MVITRYALLSDRHGPERRERVPTGRIYRRPDQWESVRGQLRQQERRRAAPWDWASIGAGIGFL